MTPHDILSVALPGEKIAERCRPAGWKRLPELPWLFWQSCDQRWAVFLLVGRRFSSTAQRSVRKVRDIGLEPIVVVPQSANLAALSDLYLQLRPHVACEIAGKPELLPPPNVDVTHRAAVCRPNTRVPRSLLSELSNHTSIGNHLRRQLAKLTQSYASLARRRANNDDDEHRHLDTFGRWMLKNIGFWSATCEVPAMIRRLEQGGWGGSRDHFFHSFQNFFFGLYVVSKLSESFVESQTVTKLNWVVDPFHVWFLTALWHDVGYGIQSFQNVTEDVWGLGSAEEVDTIARSQFLSRSDIQEALRVISSLMARLLAPGDAVSSWMPPTNTSRLGPMQRRLLESLKDDVSGDGHGAASALRLYADLIPKVNRMTSPRRDQIHQTILLACASMPFHDWRFRACVRQNRGSCEIPVEAMPFAGMLAFVDSIQDDRRNIAGLHSEVRFLERLLVRRPRRVSAKVNPAALSPSDVLWKVVESRDVLRSLLQREDAMTFSYPSWMTGE